MPTAMQICQANIELARSRVPIADPAPDHYRDPTAERQRMALNIVGGKPEWFRKDFAEYLRDNFHVYVAFEREADKVWQSGRRHYSGRTIVEVLRHQSALADTAIEFKLNDWWTPDLCRLWMELHQDRDGFFETRSGQSAVRSR